MTESTDLVIDLFAGPGGWDEGARLVGVPGRIIGLELDENACATALAAGHDRYRCDLTMVPVDRFGPFRGLIGSPPCPPFSNAGKGLGKLDRPRILRHVERIREAGRWLHYSREGWHDAASPLTLEPLRWALEGAPEWIALEQVPAVLPLWEAFADVLRERGYSVATGKLSAERYGVPQTRQRAFLVARKRIVQSFSGWLEPTVVELPAPTHQGYTKRKPFDPDSLLPRWVSMAEALGWGMTERPYPVLASGRTTGGPDREKVGGSGARAAIYAEQAAGRWQLRQSLSDQGTRKSPPRTLDEPAQTVTGKTRSAEWQPVGMAQAGATSTMVDPRPVDEPAGTITGKGTAPVQAVRVSVEEAARLQSVRDGYPWQGSKTAQYGQVGNLVPPLLAGAVLGNLLGLDGWRDVCMSMRPAIAADANEAATDTVEGVA